MPKRWLLAAAALLLVLIPGDAAAKKKKKKKKKRTIPWTAIAPDKEKSILDVGVEANLSKEAVFKPFSIAPDYRYSPSKELSVGAIHGTYNRTGFYGGVGSGLCLNALGSPRDQRNFVAGRRTNPPPPSCNRFYDNFGVQGVYKLGIKGVGLGLVGGLYFESLGPVATDLKLGARFRYQKKRFIFLSETNAHLAVSQIGPAGTNPSDFFLPLGFHYMASKRVLPFFQTGLRHTWGPVQDTGVPLTAGVNGRLDKQLWLGGSLSYLDVSGVKLGPEPLQQRSLNGWVGYLF